MKINEIEKKSLKLPNINVGDEVKVGRFKNRKAEVKGFKKDKHNQPVLKTTKGDQKLFKPRISKLEEIKRKWIGDKHPKDMSQDEFMKLHRTGFIPSHVYIQYEEYNGLDWVNPKKYPKIIAKRNFDGKKIQFRKSGQKNKYVKTDNDLASGEIVRDEQGLATYLTNKEIRERNLPTENQTIAVFYNDHPIGLASNEFGAIGVWIIRDFQNKGIGTMLLRIFMKQNPHMKIGQMTVAGDSLARNVWKSFQKEGLAEAVIKLELQNNKRVTVWKNPSKQQLENLIKKYDELRGLEDEGKDFYVWDAMAAIHGDIISSLAMNGRQQGISSSDMNGWQQGFYLSSNPDANTATWNQYLRKINNNLYIAIGFKNWSITTQEERLAKLISNKKIKFALGL